jgi:hypothetical protein
VTSSVKSDVRQGAHGRRPVRFMFSLGPVPRPRTHRGAPDRQLRRSYLDEMGQRRWIDPSQISKDK